jgi:hypothetical protein
MYKIIDIKKSKKNTCLCRNNHEYVLKSPISDLH